LIFWHDMAAGKAGPSKAAAVEVRPAGTGKGVKTAKTVK